MGANNFSLVKPI